jgi:aspartate carbamoyltransferase
MSMAMSVALSRAVGRSAVARHAPAAHALGKRTFASESSFGWHRLWSARDLSRADIDHAIDVATTLGANSRGAGPWRRAGSPPLESLDVLKGRVLANMFFEPSTRTQSSFATAMLRMGGTYLNLNVETSSSKKGETLLDTVKVMSEYADALVIRHPSANVFEQLAGLPPHIPVINAGNGALEHPTQALLDLLCMKTELGSLDGLRITLVGDLKYGRTVHSLSCVLSRFDNMTINLVSPPELRLPQEWLDNMRAVNPGNTVRELETYKDVVDETDVLYMTRIQAERFDSVAAYEAVKGSFVLTPADLASSKAIVMHPLPRVNEIDPAVDALPGARYFEQVGYGVVMRMALLGLAMGAKM